MSILLLEGFEDYSSDFDNVIIPLGYSKAGFGPSNSTANGFDIISATDVNGIAPKNDGSCLKLSSSLPSQSSGPIDTIQPFYPRVLFKRYDNQTNTSGVFGFAFLPRLATNGGWGNFTPIACIVNSDNKPHFYLGLNSSLQLEVRRFFVGNMSWPPAAAWWHPTITYNSSVYTWQTNPRVANYCDKGGCTKGWIFSNGQSTGGVGNTAITNSSLVPLGVSSSTVLYNNWNYVEIKYSMSNTTGGSIQVKLNRTAQDTDLDINLTSIKNTDQTNTNCLGIVLGTQWGHDTNGNGMHTQQWNSYIDDIYWCDLTGSYANDFLGKITIKKYAYDTVVNYNMVSPSDGATALTNVSDSPLNAVSSLNSVVLGDTLNQALNLKASSVASGNLLNPIAVQQVVHGFRTTSRGNIGLGASLESDSTDVTSADLGQDAVNGTIRSKVYYTDPAGNDWNNTSISNTTFINQIVQTT